MPNLRLLSFLLLLLPIAGFSQNVANAPNHQERFVLDANSHYVQGRILFKVRPEYRAYCGTNTIAEPHIQKAMQMLSVTSLTKAFTGSTPPRTEKNEYGQKLVDLSLIYEMDYSANIGIEDAINLLAFSSAIDYAQPNYMYEGLYDPADPDTTSAWWINAMELKHAWDVSKGDSAWVAGVVDTGISFINPEFFGQIALNPNDTIDGLDNDNDGYIDNYRGWDFGGDYFTAPQDNDPSWCCGEVATDHGVLCAGIIAAKPDNNICIPGAGFYNKVLPVKVSANHTTWLIRAYQGVVYAADHGAKVINMSFGGSERDRFGYDAVYYAAVNKGVLCVAAAGNTVMDIRLYPASYPWVMSTGGTESNDSFWDYGGNPAFGSSYSYQVDIAAPAATITTTAQDAICWGGATGTSMAAPMVCGISSLVHGADPSINPHQIGQRIRVTADNTPYTLSGAFYTEKMGHGEANAYRAVTETGQSVRALEVEYDDHNDGIFMGGDTIDVRVRYLNYLDPIAALNVTLTTPNPSFITILNGDAFIGDMGNMDTASMWHCPFKIKINAGVPSNFTGNLKFTYTGTAYSDFEYYTIDFRPSFVSIDQNNIETSIDNIGHFSLFNFPTNSQGTGTLFEDVGYYTLDAGFLVGNSSTKVSNNIRNAIAVQDAHFQSVQTATRVVPGPLADLEATSIFNDNGAGANTLGIETSEMVYQYKSEEDKHYMIVEYTLENTTGSDITNAYAGMYADWEMGVPDSNFTVYKPLKRLVMLVDSTHYAPHFGGWAVLTPDSLHAFTVDPTAYSWTTANKFAAMSADPNALNTAKMNMASMISSGPFTIPAGSTHKVAFAWIEGLSYNEVYDARDAAQLKYDCVIAGGMTTLADLGSDVTWCNGATNITLNPGAGFSTYLWNDGSSGSTLPVNSSGTYSVTVTDANGCIDYDEITIIIHEGLNGSFSVAPGNSVMVGDTVWFTDLTTGANEWCWSFGDGSNNCPIVPGVSHSYTSPGDYIVTMIVSNGPCSDTVTQTIHVDSLIGISSGFEQNTVSAYPVPTEDILNVTLDNSYRGTVEYRVVSLAGVLIRTEREVKLSGSYAKQISLAGVSDGIYFLEVIMGDRKETVKVAVN